MAEQTPSPDKQATKTDSKKVDRISWDQIEEDRMKPEENFYSWKSPSRPFKKRDREFYSTIAVIVFLVSLILLFAGQFLLIAVVVSLAFVSYVLASIPPEEVVHRITSHGVHTGTQFFFWEEMGRFWFTKKYRHDLLQIETSRFPGRAILLVDPEEKMKVRTILTKYLVQQTPLPTFLDKAADWLQEKVPLEKVAERPRSSA